MPETDVHVLYLTEKCNLACDYCYERNKSGRKMTKEVAKETIDTIMSEYSDEYTVKFLLFGGEPFLNYEVLLYCVDYLYNEWFIHRNRQVVVTTTSNGTLIKKDRVRELAKYRKIFNIEVSIDGDKDTQDINRKFASGIGSHDIVVKNVKVLLQYFPYATARLVIVDVDKYLHNVQYLHGLGFKQFLFQAVRYCSGTNKYTPNYDERYCEVTEQVLEYLKQDKFSKINGVQYPLSKSDQTKAENSFYNYVLADGGRIKQKQFVQQEFQHFTKGVDAEYNLLKK